MKWIAQGGKDSIIQFQFDNVDDFLLFLKQVVIPVAHQYGIEVKLERRENSESKTKIPVLKP